MMEKSLNVPRLTVVAAIIRRHGTVLAAQRPEGKLFGGYWELPGGKVEPAERPEDALCRELAEELGINVTEYSLCKVSEHDYQDMGYTVILHFFEVKKFKGEPIPKEGQNLRWLTPKDISELTFLPADEEMLSCLFTGVESD